MTTEVKPRDGGGRLRDDGGNLQDDGGFNLLDPVVKPRDDDGG